MYQEILKQATEWGYECYHSPEKTGDSIKIDKKNWHFQEIEANKWTIVINGFPQLYLTPKELMTFLEKLNEEN
ncbi:hypothetical protein PCC7424_5122 [Gloeothece citriformis PCC 7424]|uniref:Uncharacterized protein n=1 Tax=Gloeothece citriformis (strain PCC 7424) TaxID=65393 RepID=B7KGY6_GLOC7|nr:hypothetical protein [Gloeothece citriformis]ACK73473.1 hypothetical protein PCC7424_5122 [Gloeothece citriformis PCC 7424]